MAEFLDKHVTSEQEWDKYCHYVAGLVGIGLSRLFSASELEDPLVGEDVERANSMGLFLQKQTSFVIIWKTNEKEESFGLKRFGASMLRSWVILLSHRILTRLCSA